MSEQTWIKGKDAALEESIETMSRRLEAIGIDIEQVSWLNPVPNVHSVHIRDRDCGLMFTNGKGASEKACLASALGEYFERLSTNYFFADFYLGPDIARGDFVHYPNERWFDPADPGFRSRVLSPELWRFYDPAGELDPARLFDTNSGAGERGICCLPFQRQRDEHPVWFPVNIVANLYVSNGMSAGNSANEARVQALSEIFERAIKNRIIAEGISLPRIPAGVLARYPSIEAAVRALEAHGYHLRLADASLGGRYPVIAVTLINPRNATVFASFGAHPSFEVALERTVTEMLQGRDLDQLDGFQPPTLDLDEAADPHNLETHFIDSSGLLAYDFFRDTPDFPFHDWDFDADTGREFETLCRLLHEEGHDIYIADYEHLGVYACRILVPGFSEIYPVDDLVWGNNNEGALLREAILSLHRLDDTELLQLFERLGESGYDDFQGVCEFIGIAPDPDSAWASLRIGELKAMIALALGLDEARDWIDWCIHLQQLPPHRHRLYEALAVLAGLQPDQFEQLRPILGQLFGVERIERARALLAGTQRFDGLHSPGLSLEGFGLHRRLLEGYDKLQRMKRDNAHCFPSPSSE
jgi:ribosomal protein S12 methylthiotransferase accessory factor